MNDIRTDYSMHRDVLTRDVNALLTDVQALLRDVANEAGTEAAQAGTEVGMRLRELKGDWTCCVRRAWSASPNGPTAPTSMRANIRGNA